MTDSNVVSGSDVWTRWRDVATRAAACGLNEPAAAALATATPDGRPSVRMVLVRTTDERGFVFYTNATSRKGEELRVNARAALCFYWDPLHEQVRIEGPVEPCSDDESDAYWVTRPRQAQIGAWASAQSRPLPSREALEAQVAAIAARFEGQAIPRPPHWHGFRILPDRFEFWRGREGRLHERILFERTASTWIRSMLQP